MEFEIFIRPLSVNACYATTKKGTLYMKPEAKEYIESIRAALRGADIRCTDDEIELRIHAKLSTRHRIDVDNILKPLLDALQGYVYQNDNQIHTLTVKRSYGHSTDSIEFVVQWMVENDFPDRS